VPVTRVPNGDTILNCVRYQSDPFHIPSHPIKWCPWTIARLGGGVHRSLDSIPSEYSLGEVLPRYIHALVDSFVLIGVPRWILRSR
jgi:hypothetical protein